MLGYTVSEKDDLGIAYRDILSSLFHLVRAQIEYMRQHTDTDIARHSDYSKSRSCKP